MKNVLLILSAACFMFVVACGPSAEEQAAEAKRIVDSTATAIQHVNDSIAEVVLAAETQRLADSTVAANAKAVEDSIAAEKKKQKKSTASKKEEPKTKSLGDMFKKK